MKKTVFHEIYSSIRRDWDGWLLGLIILSLFGYGISWLSTIFDLNPIHWLSALGDYAYAHGGTVSFIAMMLCITGIIITLLLISAWKGAKAIIDRERWNIRKALDEVKSLRQQLNEIQKNITEIRDVLKTIE